MKNWFRKTMRKPPSFRPRRQIYVERPCIGCMRPFKRWGVSEIPLIEQFCSKRCEHAFYHGYGLGLRVVRDIRIKRRM